MKRKQSHQGKKDRKYQTKKDNDIVKRKQPQASQINSKREHRNRFQDQPNSKKQHYLNRQNSLMSSIIHKQKKQNKRLFQHNPTGKNLPEVSPAYKKKRKIFTESSEYEFEEKSCFEIFCLWCLRLCQKNKSHYQDYENRKRIKKTKKQQDITDSAQSSQQNNKKYISQSESSSIEQSASIPNSSLVSQEIIESFEDLNKVKRPQNLQIKRFITPTKVIVKKNIFEPVQEESSSQLEQSISKLKTLSSQYIEYVEEIPPKRKPQRQRPKTKTKNPFKSPTKSDILKRRKNYDQKSVRKGAPDFQMEKKKLKRRLKQISEEQKKTHKRNGSGSSSQQKKLRDLQGLVQEIFERKFMQQIPINNDNYSHPNVFHQHLPQYENYRGNRPNHNTQKVINQRMNYFSPQACCQYPPNRITPFNHQNYMSPHSYRMNPEAGYPIPKDNIEFNDNYQMSNYSKRNLNQNRRSSEKNQTINFRDQTDSKVSQIPTLKNQQTNKFQLNRGRNMKCHNDQVKDQKKTGNFIKQQPLVESSARYDFQFDVIKNQDTQRQLHQPVSCNISFGTVRNANRSAGISKVRRTLTNKKQQNPLFTLDNCQEKGQNCEWQKNGPESVNSEKKVFKNTQNMTECGYKENNLGKVQCGIAATQDEENQVKSLVSTLKQSLVFINVDSTNSISIDKEEKQLQIKDVSFLVSQNNYQSSSMSEIVSLYSQISGVNKHTFVKSQENVLNL